MADLARIAARGLLALALACAGAPACRAAAAPDRLFAEAERLRLRYERTASEQAIDRYRAARAGWQAAGELRQAAVAGQRAALVYEHLGSMALSLQEYEVALSLARQSADRLLESDLLSDVGMARALVADREMELEESHRACLSALALAREWNGIRQEADALNCLGEVEYHRGNLEPALSLYRQAEARWHAVADARGLAQTLLFQGYALSDLSELDSAGDRYKEALQIWTTLADKRGKAITLVAEARLRQRRAEFQEALNKFLQALSLLEPMGDAIWEGSSLTGVATVYLQMAEVDHAIKYWERALQLFERAGLKNYAVDVQTSLGETHLASGDHAVALTSFERALALAEELGNRRWQSNALRLLGVTHLQRRQPDEARRYLERAWLLQQSLQDRRLDAQTQADMGEACLVARNPSEARGFFQTALGLSRAAGDRVEEARALFGLGRAALAAGDLDGARGYSARSLAVAESLRTQVDNRDLRTTYLASVHRYFELHIEVLMQLHRARRSARHAAAAFEVSERARARALLDTLVEAGVDPRAELDEGLAARLDTIDRQLAEWAERQRKATAGARAAAAVDALDEEYRALQERYALLLGEIKSRSPRFAALAHPGTAGLRQVQQTLLDSETLLLEFALGDERSYLWVISNHGFSSYQLPPRREIEREVRAVYERVTARLHATGTLQERRGTVARADAEYRQAAARLSEMLFGALAPLLRGQRLVIVADGSLQYLPVSALPIPGRSAGIPLLVEHEIVHLPSASVLALIRRERTNRRQPAGAVAVLADPVFEADDPRLPAAARRTMSAGRAAGSGDFLVPRLASTRHEAEAIVAATSPAAALKAVDFEASRSTALSAQLADYRIVHFATHSIVDDEHPGRAGIVLSMFGRDGRPQDGFLRLHDLYGLHLPVDLVVLSACSTALGRAVRGEGLVGMVRGFMHAGASRVVASLWKVDDEATGELMRHFYEEMFGNGRTPAQALRHAQLAMRSQERWQAPFYWAAFALQGDWK